MVESFGKFDKFLQAGCFPVFWPCQAVVGEFSLRLNEVAVCCETKTKDNVFVMITVSVQYEVSRDKLYEAYYLLSDPKNQMQSYVSDVIRASMCSMTLDEAFESKQKISDDVKYHLRQDMESFGYTIVQTLVTDMTPDLKVRDAMNEINASKRMKEAAYQRAEGEKVVKVKRAEAEAESMYLAGVGVARQRKAIMDGLKDSIVLFSSEVKGTGSKDIMDLMILTQYFDTLTEVGHNEKTKVVFMSNDNAPVRNGMMQANASLGY